MIKSKRQMFIIISVFALVMLLGTVTYAFFNYTRTGSSNNIRVGRISFVSKNEETITLSNIFPIDPSESGIMEDNTKVGTYSIEIKGDTDYADGIEYLVSAVDTNIYTNGGQIVPISLDVTVTDLGTASPNYWTARESKNATIYKKIVGDTLVGDQMLLVGYIKKNTTSGIAEGVDGSITIKAYLDKNKILISDTYDGSESDNMGTTNRVAEGKTVLTTSEWNALQNTDVSFKVKVEANEGIWVIGSMEEIMSKNSIGIDTDNGVDFSKTSTQNGTNGIYMMSSTASDTNPILYYRGAVTDNNIMFNNYCWKAVRTTDTGGVKLIYSGEQQSHYISDGDFSRSDYTNVVTPYNDYTFDSTDNSWNVTYTDSGQYEFVFSVPTGDNYTLVLTGTTSVSSGGAYTFYKNGTAVYSYGNGSGASYSDIYSFGSLLSTDVLRVSFAGSASVSDPITLKIIMQQNSVALSQSDYVSGDTFTFDETNKKWSKVVEPNHRVSMEFSVSEAGDYLINYTTTTIGTFNIKRGDSNISNAVGSRTVTILNLEPTEKITIDYFNNTGSNNGEVEFYLSKAIYDRQVCDSNGWYTVLPLSGDYVTRYARYENSPAYVGYMYGTAYTYQTTNWNNNAKFGSDFTWDGTHYKLTNPVSAPDATHHYSCNESTDDAECTSIRYVYWLKSDGTKYYILLSNGKGIEDALNEMNTNTNESLAKKLVDEWYEANMTNVTDRLEDTIWCNDRSIGKYNGWSKTGTIDGNTSSITNYGLIYGGNERSNYGSSISLVKNQPSLACPSKNDSFTVTNKNGNQKLNYPSALITLDELIMAGDKAGSSTNSYINNISYLWTMTPINFTSSSARMFMVHNSNLDGSVVSSDFGIRPVISIKPGQLIKSGTGTQLDPYIIE